MKSKLGSKNIGIDEKRVVKPIEDLLDLQGIVRLNLRGRRVGAYLLRKSKKHPFTLVFGFRCKGIHSFLRSEEVESIFEQLQSGLKDFPLRGTLTIHLSTFRSD